MRKKKISSQLPANITVITMSLAVERSIMNIIIMSMEIKDIRDIKDITIIIKGTTVIMESIIMKDITMNTVAAIRNIGKEMIIMVIIMNMDTTTKAANMGTRNIMIRENTLMGTTRSTIRITSTKTITSTMVIIREASIISMGIITIIMVSTVNIIRKEVITIVVITTSTMMVITTMTSTITTRITRDTKDIMVMKNIITIMIIMARRVVTTNIRTGASTMASTKPKYFCDIPFVVNY